jgi:hypothetical protein
MAEIKVNYALLCDYAFLTAEKKPAIIGVFKNISAAEFPVTYPKFFVVANLEFFDINGSVEIEFSIKDGTGTDVLAPLVFNTEIKGKRVDINFVADVSLVVFNKPGKHFIQIADKNGFKHTIGFEVEKR